MQRRTANGLAIAFIAFALLAMPVGPAARANTPSDDTVKALALQWFAAMETGKIDRTQLTPQYGAQLTDESLKAMAAELKQYGSAPLGARVLRTRTFADQTIYLVKLLFPRGDAAAMLLGLDADGKITGIDFVSIAGD